ncbi:MAG TPA: response regulator [Pyrinomonadaceae bacterium]|nr:response regulator [Pyrinomonadaceae bacterium]
MTKSAEIERPEILVVDDELHFLDSLRELLRKDYLVHTTNDPCHALKLLEERNIAVVLCDQRMPQLSGAELLTSAARIKPETVRILLTGFSDLEAVIQAVNEGKLYQYVSKPFEPESFLRLLGQATAVFALVHERRQMIEELRTLNDDRLPVDIDAVQLAEENESLARDNQVLRSTIANFQNSYWCVRRFQEVLPICMTCSKVRLGKVDWMELAVFIRQHSDFLSHSYCPECAEIAIQSIPTFC